MNMSSLTSPVLVNYCSKISRETIVAGTCSTKILFPTQPGFKFLTFSNVHSSQTISLPEIIAKIGSLKTKNQGGKPRKEKQLGKDILNGKIICGKGVKPERDQDMTPQNKSL